MHWHKLNGSSLIRETHNEHWLAPSGCISYWYNLWKNNVADPLKVQFIFNFGHTFPSIKIQLISSIKKLHYMYFHTKQ